MKLRIRELVDSEDGFTLIELMVVVTILATLLVISLPTFVGARSRAQDAAAKASAARALTTARVVYSDHVSYTSANATALTTAEPSMTFFDQATASTGPKVASGDNSDPTGNTFIAAVWSSAGNCYYIRDRATVGVDFARAPGVSQSTCRANNIAGVTFGSTW
jgi:prepilin-type N-terminal cleavage/methylation domain-containing protein